MSQYPFLLVNDFICLMTCTNKTDKQLIWAKKYCITFMLEHMINVKIIFLKKETSQKLMTQHKWRSISKYFHATTQNEDNTERKSIARRLFNISYDYINKSSLHIYIKKMIHCRQKMKD